MKTSYTVAYIEKNKNYHSHIQMFGTFATSEEAKQQIVRVSKTGKYLKRNFCVQKIKS